MSGASSSSNSTNATSTRRAATPTVQTGMPPRCHTRARSLATACGRCRRPTRVLTPRRVHPRVRRPRRPGSARRAASPAARRLMHAARKFRVHGIQRATKLWARAPKAASAQASRRPTASRSNVRLRVCARGGAHIAGALRRRRVDQGVRASLQNRFCPRVSWLAC